MTNHPSDDQLAEMSRLYEATAGAAPRSKPSSEKTPSSIGRAAFASLLMGMYLVAGFTVVGFAVMMGAPETAQALGSDPGSLLDWMGAVVRTVIEVSWPF